ncbi:MAG: hypothetical protein NXY59_05210 [Aigarchaeota archaeon]|nr:hypothetical protein [Candidatus Pelearchaeum maunauluense]
MSSDSVRVLEASGEVVARASAAIIYLLTTLVGIAGGWITGLLSFFIEPSPYFAALIVGIFAALFAVAGIAYSIIARISDFLSLLTVSPEERRNYLKTRKRAGNFIGASWMGGMTAAFLLSLTLIPDQYNLVKIPVAVSLGVSLGNLGMFLTNMRIARLFDPRPLFAGLYLLLTIPTYFTIPFMASSRPDTIMLSYILLTIHTVLAGFITASWYVISARGRVSGILHAARGEDSSSS